MASFDSINYSLRPSKGVQRGLVFEGLKSLSMEMNLCDLVYVGFGSIWFTDFIKAHKQLDVDDMVSIEADEIGFRRAEFNKVYRTIKLKHGQSGDVLPDLLDLDDICGRPWIVWLDYDYALNESVVEDMQWLVVNAPPNSILLFTFSANANPGVYGKLKHRPERIRSLLGGVVPDDLQSEACETTTLPITLATYALDFLASEVADAARLGGFVKAFSVPYVDSTAMVTVGGVLPTKGTVAAARAVVARSSWHCLLDEIIQAPQLTLKEIAALQSEMPSVNDLTRERVKEIGFDLRDKQIRSFQKYYKYLPSFAEVVG